MIRARHLCETHLVVGQLFCRCPPPISGPEPGLGLNHIILLSYKLSELFSHVSEFLVKLEMIKILACKILNVP